MTTANNTLAPCPCCGESEGQNGPWINEDGHYVACQSCGLSTGSFSFNEDAVRAWNRRAPAAGGQAMSRRAAHTDNQAALEAVFY